MILGQLLKLYIMKGILIHDLNYEKNHFSTPIYKRLFLKFKILNCSTKLEKIYLLLLLDLFNEIALSL